MRSSPQNGFSLPELLIALLIFSLIASASVYSLRLGVEARDQLSRSDDRLRQYQLARKLMKEDFAQATGRLVRDEYGQPLQANFLGGSNFPLNVSAERENLLVAFVRRGWSNPNAEAPRSSLQYVQYLIANDTLIRRIRPYLDDARNQPVFDRVMIDDISNAEIMFFRGELSGRLEWVAAWPIAADRATIPEAVSLTITTARYGELRQLFWIGGIASQ